MKTEITDTVILGLPLVINNEVEPEIIHCLEGKHRDCLSGNLELHCRRATYEKVLNTPKIRAHVALNVAKIKQRIASNRDSAS